MTLKEDREAERLERYQWKLSIVRDAVCVDCGKTEREAFEAGYPLQGDHLVRQQTLRRNGLLDKLWDPRNGQARCEWPCHLRRTNGKTRLDPESLTDDNWAFADENGLRHALERECESRAA